MVGHETAFWHHDSMVPNGLFPCLCVRYRGYDDRGYLPLRSLLREALICLVGILCHLYDPFYRFLYLLYFHLYDHVMRSVGVRHLLNVAILRDLVVLLSGDLYCPVTGICFCLALDDLVS